ncbi:MAG: hypothetical protein IT337_11295 [Thermomicrobiales bacterium]|nr:hypothetical protein [Thermomicrobiales bacterium]
MQRSLIAILFAAMLLAPAAASAQGDSPAASVADAGSLVRTQTRIFLPYGPNGVNSQLTVETETDAVCDVSSAASPGRPDARRCITTDSQVLDPCFQNPFSAPGEAGAQLVCVNSPVATTATVVTLTESFAAPAPTPGSERDLADELFRMPWVLELADGETCGAMTGATIGFAGLRVNYGCTGGGVLLGEPDRSGPVWTVDLLPTDGIATTDVEVVAAWA